MNYQAEQKKRAEMAKDFSYWKKIAAEKHGTFVGAQNFKLSWVNEVKENQTVEIGEYDFSVRIKKQDFPNAERRAKWSNGEHHYSVEIFLEGSNLNYRTVYTQGSGWNSWPKAFDILQCVVSDAIAGSQSFEDFCGDFDYDTDYDTDSRKAEKIWQTCNKTYFKLRQALGGDEKVYALAEKIREIEEENS